MPIPAGTAVIGDFGFRTFGRVMLLFAQTWRDGIWEKVCRRVRMIAMLRKIAVIIGKVQRRDIMMKTCKICFVLFLQSINNSRLISAQRIDCTQRTRPIEQQE